MTRRAMKIKILKNQSGILSGVVIPVEELSELKGSIKNDTELYRIIDDLLSDQKKASANKDEIILSSGRTIRETEDEGQRITDRLYLEAFRKGIPMFYKDVRTTGASQFVRANPDGSEDLVEFNSEKREYIFLERLAQPGKGHWSYLISA